MYSLSQSSQDEKALSFSLSLLKMYTPSTSANEEFEMALLRWTRLQARLYPSSKTFTCATEIFESKDKQLNLWLLKKQMDCLTDNFDLKSEIIAILSKQLEMYGQDRATLLVSLKSQLSVVAFMNQKAINDILNSISQRTEAEFKMFKILFSYYASDSLSEISIEDWDVRGEDAQDIAIVLTDLLYMLGWRVQCRKLSSLLKDSSIAQDHLVRVALDYGLDNEVRALNLKSNNPLFTRFLYCTNQYEKISNHDSNHDSFLLLIDDNITRALTMLEIV